MTNDIVKHTFTVRRDSRKFVTSESIYLYTEHGDVVKIPEGTEIPVFEDVEMKP